MSVTFMLPCEFRKVTREEHERTQALACLDCGGNLYVAPLSADHDCDSCYGYGGDTEAQDALKEREATEDGEFNVANANAIYIVQDLLNMSGEDIYCGSLHPALVLSRLGFTNTAGGVVDPSEGQAVKLTPEGVSLGCKYINAGRSQRQCDSYVVRLRKLAEIAIERGAPEIRWG